MKDLHSHGSWTSRNQIFKAEYFYSLILSSGIVQDSNKKRVLRKFLGVILDK